MNYSEAEEEIGRCGRPTKSGNPCRNVTGGDFPCQSHSTELDKHYIRVANEYFQRGFKAGDESGRQSYRWELEKAAQDAEDIANFRLETVTGQQIVQVGAYTFSWDFKKHGGLLSVGDDVRLSGGYSGGWNGTVTKIGSSYRGDIREIGGRA